jgi:hypothetical protein
LHQRLIDGHTAAPSELAQAYWQPLLEYLGRTYPRAPEDFRAEAAGDTLISLIKRPTAYDPARMDLFPYLRMSASRDLLNRMKREARHHKRRVGLDRVEHLPDAGKYQGWEADPLLRLCAAEAGDVLPDPAVAAVRASATPEEQQVLELMLRGERRTAVYAASIHATDWPAAEQKALAPRAAERNGRGSELNGNERGSTNWIEPRLLWPAGRRAGDLTDSRVHA